MFQIQFRSAAIPNFPSAISRQRSRSNASGLWTVFPRRRLSIKNYSPMSDKIIKNVKDEVKSFDSVPGPPSWPVVGNLDFLGKGSDKFHLLLIDQARKYKGIYRTNVFGRKMLVINDPVILEKIYREEEKWPVRDLSVALAEFFKARKMLSLPPGLTEIQGEEWGQLRSIMNKHLLKPLNVKNYYDGFNRVTKDALANLSVMRDSNNVVEDVYRDLLGKWSMESIGTFTFGQRVGLLDNPPNTRGMNTYEGMRSVFATSYKISLTSWMKYIFPFKARQLQNDVRKLYENGIFFVNNVFQHLQHCAEKGTPVDKDIGTSLVAYLLKKDGMSQNECASQSIDIYSAGLDTSTATVFWLMYLLGLNPEKQQKLFQEVNSVIAGDDMVNYSDVQRMPYLRACFKESARMHPTTTALQRIYEKDIVLEGYLIPAGTHIINAAPAMGRDENIFHDADSFIPERWLRGNENAEKIHQFAVRPFGFGVRSCVGKQVVEAEMQVFISQLVKKFRFEFLDKKLVGKMTLIIEPEEPRRFAFYDR